MSISFLQGDCLSVLKTLPDESVNCCVTSPPYFGLRSYNGGDAEIGREQTPDQYIAKMVEVMREVKRVLREDGTLWLNIGDSYARVGGTDRKVSPTAQVGSTRRTLDQMPDRKQSVPDGLKNKDLIGIPWMLAFALRTDGWYLRQDIIWHKPNPMPEPVKDRCVKAHEYVFLLSKSARYHFDHVAIQEPKVCFRKRGAGRSKHNGDRNDNGDMAHYANKDLEKGVRNKRGVWTIPTRSYKGAHFATFPPDLIRPCILAGCPGGGVVLDPFGGSGTTGQVAKEHGRNAILIELNPDYIKLAKERCGES